MAYRTKATAACFDVPLAWGGRVGGPPADGEGDALGVLELIAFGLGLSLQAPRRTSARHTVATPHTWASFGIDFPRGRSDSGLPKSNGLLPGRTTRVSRLWTDDPGLTDGASGESPVQGTARARAVRKGVRDAVEIIGILIAGLIIGLLGKFVAPGDKDNTPIWLTLLCGIGGVLLGYWISGALGVKDTNGIDWIRWIISILVAAVLVSIASTVTGRNTRSRLRV